MSTNKKRIALRTDLEFCIPEHLVSAAPQSYVSITCDVFTDETVKLLTEFGYEVVQMDPAKQFMHLVGITAHQNVVVANMDPVTSSMVRHTQFASASELRARHFEFEVSRLFVTPDAEYGYPTLRPESQDRGYHSVADYFDHRVRELVECSKGLGADIILVDDDTLTGRVFVPIKDRLPPSVRAIELSLATASIGGRAGQYDVYTDDVLDLRDFFLGANYGGLVAFDNHTRVPYWHGAIDLTKRSILTESEAAALTKQSFEISQRFYKMLIDTKSVEDSVSILPMPTQQWIARLLDLNIRDLDFVNLTSAFIDINSILNLS